MASNLLAGTAAMMEYVATAIYLASVPLWLAIWASADGFKLMAENRLLLIPLLLGIAYLGGNALLTFAFTGVGDISYEEARFAYITDRAMIAVQATASVLIVATIVYGLTIKRVPVNFIRFMVYSFIAILGVMAPLLWVPIELPGMFYVLRHLQSIALNMGLFLCVAGITVLLRDLLTHGDAKINVGDWETSD
ncbi:MAG: hypothetical protein LC677_11985 [Halomonas sp.]|nr:hypothetical protein [Halomonas sp.]